MISVLKPITCLCHWCIGNSWWCGSFPQKKHDWLKVDPEDAVTRGLLAVLTIFFQVRSSGFVWHRRMRVGRPTVNDENWPNRVTKSPHRNGILERNLLVLQAFLKHSELLYHDLWLLWCRWKLSNSRIFGPPCINSSLGGGFDNFYFHPYLGKIPILTDIFQLGWNHQLVPDHGLLEV